MRCSSSCPVPSLSLGRIATFGQIDQTIISSYCLVYGHLGHDHLFLNHHQAEQHIRYTNVWAAHTRGTFRFIPYQTLCLMPFRQVLIETPQRSQPERNQASAVLFAQSLSSFFVLGVVCIRKEQLHGIHQFYKAGYDLLAFVVQIGNFHDVGGLSQ